MNHSLFDGALWLVVFIFSTTCHEAAHAWTAFKLGDKTAYLGGQVSFNPWPHIRREPIGMVVVPVLSWLTSGYLMGWASAPFNRDWARAHPRRMALMALAGPGANLLLALGALLLLRVGVEWNVFQPTFWLGAESLATSDAGPIAEIAAKLGSLFVTLNIFLCLFNLLPVPPLDGSAMPFLLLPARAANAYFNLLSSPIVRLAGVYLFVRGVPLKLSPLYHLAESVLFPTLHSS